MKNSVKTNTQDTEAELANFNEMLLSSLPYPAMYVRQKDKIILAANQIALKIGVKIGGHCWREFSKTKYISAEDNEIAPKYPNLVPDESNIKCSFCLADECISAAPFQNNTEVKAFGSIWNTYWIKVSKDIFLHYFVDITEQKKLEDALYENELLLKLTQQISKIGTYTIDFSSGIWIRSEMLNNILGIEDDFDKTIEGWKSIIYPTWQKTIEDHFVPKKVGNNSKIDKEYKIIRQNDKAERWVNEISYPIFNEKDELIIITGIIKDITTRKQTLAALLDSKQMLLTVMDHFPGVVFWKDKNSNYLGCNLAFAIAAGLQSPTEIVGKTDFDLPWRDTEAMNYCTDDYEVMEKGKSKLHIIETQHQKNGRVIWFDTTKIPIRESTGQIIGVIGVSIDITDRKLTEDILKKNEAKFRTVADNTNDWEFWIDQHGNFRYCSPSCERITGHKASEFMQNPKLLFDIMYPDDQIVFEYHEQMENAAIDMRQEVQYRIVRPDGKIRWIGHVCQSVFDENKNYIGIRGSNRDITNRKETEQLLKTSQRKYKLLSENITDGVFICKNERFEYVNRGMSAIFGYDYHEMVGLKLLNIVMPEYQINLESFVSLKTLTNKTLNLEIECLKKDLSIIIVEMFLKYIADEKVIYGVVHDITEKKQIQKKNIIKAIIQTEEKEKAYFSKELHDGLGPLLSTIKLYLQWAKRLKSIKKRNEVILKSEEILEEALTTVKEISYKLSPHILTNYGLSSAIQSFVNKLKETNAIRINFQSNVKRRIEIEIELALYRAIIECINNSIKYAKAKNIYILLNDTGSQIQLHYKDDGIGFNIEETLAEKKGLGLYTLQNRIQTIGGELELFSEPMHGIDYKIIVAI